MRVGSFLIPGDQSQWRVNGNVQIDNEGVTVLTPF
jgi:hypothetical protein